MPIRRLEPSTGPGDLHELRLDLGLSVGGLAHELGLSRSQASHLLNGASPIQPQTARLIARLRQLHSARLWEPWPSVPDRRAAEKISARAHIAC